MITLQPHPSLVSAIALLCTALVLGIPTARSFEPSERIVFAGGAVSSIRDFDALFEAGPRPRPKVNQEFLIRRTSAARYALGVSVPPYAGNLRGYFKHLESHIRGLEIRDDGVSWNSVAKIDEGVVSILDMAIPRKIEGHWSTEHVLSQIEGQVPQFCCGFLPMDTHDSSTAWNLAAGTPIRQVFNQIAQRRTAVWTAYVCDREGGLFPMAPLSKNPGGPWNVVLMLRGFGR